MKTFCIIFTALLFLVLQPAHAQTEEEIDEALRYYPLEVGNYWEYKEVYSFIPPETTYFSIEVVADTTLANGQEYKKMRSINNPFQAHYEFEEVVNEDNQQVAYYLERVDEATANIYQWKPEEEDPFREVLIDSLLTPMNEHHDARRWPNLETFTAYRQSDEGATLSLFGEDIAVRKFIIDGLLFYEYFLAENFGLSYIYAGEGTYYTSNLIYFKDHLGNEYGESVLVSTPEEPELPQAATLSQNYPNPFNPGTQIDYALPEAAEVRIEVFNLMGQQVAELVNQRQTAGNYTVAFDAGTLASGVYLYRLTTGTTIITQKMTLVK